MGQFPHPKGTPASVQRPPIVINTCQPVSAPGGTKGLCVVALKSGFKEKGTVSIPPTSILPWPVIAYTTSQAVRAKFKIVRAWAVRC